MGNQTITAFGDLAVGLNGLLVTFLQSLEDEPTTQELNELDLDSEATELARAQVAEMGIAY